LSRGRTARRFECSSSTDGDLTEEKDLETRRKRTRRSDGVTLQTRYQDESYSPSGARQGRRNSGAAVSDRSRGPQWAGTDNPLQGVGVDRPNVTGLRDVAVPSAQAVAGAMRQVAGWFWRH